MLPKSKILLYLTPTPSPRKFPRKFWHFSKVVVCGFSFLSFFFFLYFFFFFSFLLILNTWKPTAKPTLLPTFKKSEEWQATVIKGFTKRYEITATSSHLITNEWTMCGFELCSWYDDSHIFHLDWDQMNLMKCWVVNWW